MVLLEHEDAWSMAMAAGAILTGRLWLVGALDAKSSMVTQYEWINVQVYDPTSYAFAQLPTSSGRSCGAEYDSYARTTRKAMAVWTGIARCQGFSAHENPAFWLRVLREVASPSHGAVSDVPRFFDAPDANFPRFQLTFQPKDCYDEDLHDASDAIEWVNTFCDGFFGHENTQVASKLQEYVNQLHLLARPAPTVEPVPIQIVFRIPMLRTHNQLGAALQQHRAFVRNAHELAGQLTTKNSQTTSSSGAISMRLTECQALLRGSICAQEFAEIAKYFGRDSTLRVSELCLELGNEPLNIEFETAVKSVGIKTLVTNVANVSAESLTQLFGVLEKSPSIRTLRLFNAFNGSSTERHHKWKQLIGGINSSDVEELVLERTNLNADDIEALHKAVASSSHTNRRPLVSLIVKPMVGPSISAAGYVELVKAVGASLVHADVSALCLESADIDQLLQKCPQVRSLRLGLVYGLADSRLFDLLRQQTCQLASLAVSCSQADALALAHLLADQPLDVALMNSHLSELSVNVEGLDDQTSDALLHMLDTNQSLRYFHLKRHGDGVNAPLSPRFTAHHDLRLVRKLPMAYKLAFLSVLAHDSPACPSAEGVSALQCFDAGVASEILSFSGHTVSRRAHCS